jgi:hypothetical protein
MKTIQSCPKKARIRTKTALLKVYDDMGGPGWTSSNDSVCDVTTTLQFVITTVFGNIQAPPLARSNLCTSACPSLSFLAGYLS